ncbi:MAG: putative quinol monooxygenase [Marmoricola sp.]
MSELHVVATIPAKPGSEDVIREALSALVTSTREEDGCVSYDLYESSAAPGTFVTIEVWRSQDDLDAHLRSPHLGEAFAAAGDHLAGDVSIHPLTLVG